MLAGRKIDAFALDPTERFIFAGNLSGRLLVVDADSFDVILEQQATYGAIHAIAVHERYPLVAALGLDRGLALFSYNERSGELTRLFYENIRAIPCWNDVAPVESIYSLSQALAFHPSEKRLAVRSGTNGLLEISVDRARFDIIHCTRMHRGVNIVTFRYTGDGFELLSAAGGELVLSRNGLRLKEWILGSFNLHWLEPVEDQHYLIASDDLRVIRFGLKDDVTIFGDRITRDDLEHVTYNKRSRRAFVAGFDRDIYEIHPRTCNRIQVAWNAPFKTRWIRTLLKEPDHMIVQCFNGGLYKVNLRTREVVREIRATPAAIWTAHGSGGYVDMAGEGAAVVRFSRSGTEETTYLPQLTCDEVGERADHQTYAKRLWIRPSGQRYLAQTNGRIIDATEVPFRVLADFQCAVRDLAASSREETLFACTEDGRAFKLDAKSGKVIAEWTSNSEEPLWSLALNEARGLLVVAERRGRLVFLDACDLSVRRTWTTTSRPKRMKWLDDNTLVHVQTKTLNKYAYDSGKSTIWIQDCGNTIEDFIWDNEHRYLVAVGYRTEVVVCDFASGAKISVVPDQPDYTKGLAWMPKPGDGVAYYPYDFMTFGRSGTAHVYRIHNDRCVALGPIDQFVRPASSNGSAPRETAEPLQRRLVENG